MKRVIDNKFIDLSDEEFEYYKELTKFFDKDDFRGLFKSDKDGNILSLTPSPQKATAMVLIFFFLNVMMNQKLRKIDSLSDRVSELEKKLLEMI